MPPFKRPGLGPLLTDPDLIAGYDVLFASSIDRLGRSAYDLQQLRRWADEHGKTIQIEKPDLVWPVPSGTAGHAHRIMWDTVG